MISRCLPGIFPSPKVLSSQVGVHTPRALEDKAATLHKHQVFKRSLLQPQRPPLTPMLLRKSKTPQALALGVSIAQTHHSPWSWHSPASRLCNSTLLLSPDRGSGASTVSSLPCASQRPPSKAGKPHYHFSELSHKPSALLGLAHCCGGDILFLL